MRYQDALTIAACLAVGFASLPAVRSQDGGLQPYYWPNRTVGIPVGVDSIAKLSNKPTDLQLYYSVNRGPFQKAMKLPLSNMQELNSGKRGFNFTADRDGDFEFTVQFIYSDGTTSPAFEDLRPQQRIIIDTTPPVIRIAPIASGVEWSVTDDNLDPRKLALKCRWPGNRDWMPITDRALRPVDRYNWQLQSGKVLEVRLEAEDRAGHKSVSPVIRVSQDVQSGGTAGTNVSRPGPSTPSMGGSPSIPAPRIEYVNTLKFDVDYTIQHMGRSGIQAAHMFVLRNQGNWELVKRFPVHVTPGDRDQTLSLPYEAKEEGTYGFYVIPESGAGKRAENPRRDDPPLMWVVVDTTPPVVKITDVRVKPGGSRGPVVEITWDASDPNLMPQPVSLEWSTDKKKWNEIKYRLDNLPGSTMGRYAWEVPDENLWKFWIRARAVDKASNTGESMWPQEVIVDLEQPSAGIIKIRGGGSPPPDASSNPPKRESPSDALPMASPSIPPAVPSVPVIPPG